MDTDKLTRAVCSFFVPGLGQLMNGEIGKGLALLIIFIVLWIALLSLGIIIVQTIFGIVVRLFAAWIISCTIKFKFLFLFSYYFLISCFFFACY